VRQPPYAMRRIDLRYATVRIRRSRVQGPEAGTKTQRSNRELHLHANLVEVLKAHMPLHVEPDDYVFTTPNGAPISVDSFYHREWLPIEVKKPLLIEGLRNEAGDRGRTGDLVLLCRKIDSNSVLLTISGFFGLNISICGPAPRYY